MAGRTAIIGMTALLPFAIAAALAVAAYALRLLTRGGAVAAAIVGAAAFGAGWRWAGVLLLFFLSSSALSHWRRAVRERLVAPIHQKGDRRDSMQVIANGGVFAVAALFAAIGAPGSWEAAGIGAIAAATSDTWSTEIGTVLGGRPRSLWGGQVVAPGTSGGITIAGCIAACVASLLVAGIAGLLQWTTSWPAIVIGGLAGSTIDSLLGATIQERRWCPACDLATERLVHTCGNVSVDRGGVSGCNNDIVNLMSTVAGAAVTWIIA